MGARHRRGLEVVADRVPALAAVVGALDHLAVPAGRLRGVDAVGIGGGALQVVHLPAREEGPRPGPVLALAVCREHERALASADQYAHTTHLPLPVVEGLLNL